MHANEMNFVVSDVSAPFFLQYTSDVHGFYFDLKSNPGAAIKSNKKKGKF
jgi:hypothetical protein